MGVLSKRKFTRVLKEIGLYRYYIQSRKEQGFEGRELNHAYYSSIFSSIINESLAWYLTSCPGVWDEIYTTTQGQTYQSLLVDEDKLKKLKVIVKNYFE